MTLEGYQGKKELVLSEKDKEAFESGIQKIRQKILAYGFSQDIIGNLTFTFNQYTLTIAEEERKNGAYHIYADGQPFYIMTIQSAGSLMDMVSTDDAAPIFTLPPKQQSTLLALDIGMQVMAGMEDALDFRGRSENPRIGGISASPLSNKYETVFRADPNDFCNVLDMLIGIRLYEQLGTAPSLKTKPKAPDGPQ